MIIELALLPIIAASIRLSLHRTCTSITAPWSADHAPPSVRVAITASDIAMAIRLCWTHRLPPLLRQCDTRLKLDGITGLAGEPQNLADRHRYLYDEQAQHGTKLPTWSYPKSIHKQKMGREAPVISGDVAGYMGWGTRQLLRVPFNAMHQIVMVTTTSFNHVCAHVTTRPSI